MMKAVIVFRLMEELIRLTEESAQELIPLAPPNVRRPSEKGISDANYEVFYLEF
jgi:hypothetical protein